jgi:hypothetical protein
MLVSDAPFLPSVPVLTGRRRLCRVYPNVVLITALLIWTCVARLPFLHVLHDDEGFYSAVASRWLRGELPYATSFDVKAPGIFAVFAVAQALFGVGLYVIKGLEIVFTVLGAWGLHRLLTRHASPRAAAAAAFLYPVYSLALMGVAAPCEIVQAAATIWAFALIADASAANRGVASALFGGLLIGCAVTLKQTAAFEGAGLFGWLAWRAWRRRDSLPLGAFVVAGAAPMLAFAAYFALKGHLAEFYADTVRYACERSQLWLTLKPAPWYLEFPRRLFVLAEVQLPIAALTIGAVLAMIWRKRLERALTTPLIVRLGSVWWLAAFAGALVNREPAGQYVMTLIAPGLLLVCLLLSEGIEFPAHRRRLWLSAFAVALAIQPVAALTQLAKDPRLTPDYPGVVKASQALKADGVRPGDDVLVLSRGHYVYVMTGALPRAPYFNAMHLLCDFPLPDRDPIATDFRLRPRYVVLSNPDMALACGRLPQMRRMQAWLAKDYTLMSTETGSWDSFLLYRRKS